jgi:hypothetical protein
MSYICTCSRDAIIGCYICKPKNWVLDGNVWKRKEEKKMTVCTCGGGQDIKTRGNMFAPPPSAKPVEKEYQVDEQLARLERNTQFLAEAVELINRKLCRVLRPESPTDSGNATMSLPQTPLANELLNYNNSIEMSIQNLSDITSRIEIDLK